ncbi:COG2133 Glucose/sorbosone dehydrogenases [Methylophilaceae bacterium]|jgi:glucose/arabinose dehydrogenase
MQNFQDQSQFKISLLIVVGSLLLLCACTPKSKIEPLAGYGSNPVLPAPNKELLPTVNIAPAIGWSNNAKPTAGQGLLVKVFANQLQHPRWLYVLPNGDVLVAETNAPSRTKGSFSLRGWVAAKVMKKAGAGVPSPDRIILLRDTNNDGEADKRTIFLKGLHSPFGMALIGETLYVANADAILAFTYHEGDEVINSVGTKLIDLPSGINHHWTKNIMPSEDGTKLYVTVGSNSNVAEKGLDIEVDRAAIWQVDVKTSTHQLYATGLRNPNGLAWEPTKKALWTVVNERDELGHDLVPDYLTSVKEGGFYGWPYSYYGQYVDERVTPQQPALVSKAIVPDYALGAHTASLGLAYSRDNALPSYLQNGMIVSQHGSWNRKPLSGYKVIFIPFVNGMAAGQPVNVLTDFVNQTGKANGRPVGVVIDQQGALLVADDVGNTIWRVIGK